MDSSQENNTPTTQQHNTTQHEHQPARSASKQHQLHIQQHQQHHTTSAYHEHRVPPHCSPQPNCETGSSGNPLQCSMRSNDMSEQSSVHGQLQ